MKDIFVVMTTNFFKIFKDGPNDKKTPWLGAGHATHHYLSQWWPSSLTHIYYVALCYY